MDIRAEGTPYGKLEIDVTVGAVATVDRDEIARRVREPGRALRAAVGRKLRRYGAQVLAFAIDDCGRLAAGACRLLRDISQTHGPDDAAQEYGRLVAELQHIVLAASASSAQTARGEARSW